MTTTVLEDVVGSDLGCVDVEGEADGTVGSPGMKNHGEASELIMPIISV